MPRSRKKPSSDSDTSTRRKASDTGDSPRCSTSAETQSSKSADTSDVGKSLMPGGGGLVRKRGGQTVYDQDLADQICQRLANGEPLLTICKTPGMPAESTVRNWQINDINGFAAKYAQARISQAYRWAEEIVSLSDSQPPLTPDGRYDSGAVAHQRLMVDTRKWLLSKVLPKVYGEQLNVDHGGSVTINVVTGLPDD